MKANKVLKFKRSLMAMGVAGLFAGAVACGQPQQQSEEPGMGEDTEMFEEESEYGEVPPEDTMSTDEAFPEDELQEEDTL